MGPLSSKAFGSLRFTQAVVVIRGTNCDLDWQPPDYSAVGVVRSSMWAATTTASGKPRRTMTTVMIARTIDSPMFCTAWRFQSVSPEFGERNANWPSSAQPGGSSTEMRGQGAMS